MPIGRPHAPWLRQVKASIRRMLAYGLGVCLGGSQTEAYLKDMGMTAWRLPERCPDGGLSECYGRGGSVCVGNGQTEDDGIRSQDGRRDALSTHLT